MARSFQGTGNNAGNDKNSEPGAEIAVLLTSINDQDDLRDAYALLQERIQKYRSAGWSVPEELVRVERTMITEFMAESQGR
jgi:hypothetical protein